MKTQQVVELIRFRVKPEKVQDFLSERKQVDDFVQSLEGFLSTEIFQMPEQQWLMQITWESQAKLESILPITEASPEISRWIEKNAEFVSYEIGLQRYVHSL